MWKMPAGLSAGIGLLTGILGLVLAAIAFVVTGNPGSSSTPADASRGRWGDDGAPGAGRSHGHGGRRWRAGGRSARLPTPGETAVGVPRRPGR